MRLIGKMNTEGVVCEILYSGAQKWQVASFRAMENVVTFQKFQNIVVKAV